MPSKRDVARAQRRVIEDIVENGFASKLLDLLNPEAVASCAIEGIIPPLAQPIRYLLIGRTDNITDEQWIEMAKVVEAGGS